MKLELYVCRTGNIKSKENIFLGWINAPLDNKGLEQASKIGKKLSKKKIEYGFCSDQIRGKQALLEIIKYHKGSKVIVDHRLRERNYGVYSGKSKELFKKYFSTYPHIHRSYDEKIPLGENLREITHRVFPFMKELLSFMQAEGANVLICAHTNSMRAIEEYLEDLSEDELVVRENFPNNYKKYIIKFEN